VLRPLICHYSIYASAGVAALSRIVHAGWGGLGMSPGGWNILL
jgi:hypothetical protein